MKSAELQKLRRVAQIKSDLEMKKFSALRAHVVALQSRKLDLERQLADCFAAQQAFSLAEARLANTTARQTVQAIAATQVDLNRIAQRFSSARQAAARAFGRCRALEEFETKARLDERDLRTVRRGEAV